MKKLVCVAALGAGMAVGVGCTVENNPPPPDDGPPTVKFTWNNECPDLSAAGRESAVIIQGVDSELGMPDETYEFDCSDGASTVLDTFEGTWSYSAEVVDEYAAPAGGGTPFDTCFTGDGAADSIDCLYYSDTVTVGDFDTAVEPDFDPDFDFVYGYGDFTLEYTVDGADADAPNCGVFGPDGATDVSIVATFYGGDGFVDDIFPCEQPDGAVSSRDLPLDTYDLRFDLLDANGDAIMADSAAPTDSAQCSNGACTLDEHLQNIPIVLDFQEN